MGNFEKFLEGLKNNKVKVSAVLIAVLIVVVLALISIWTVHHTHYEPEMVSYGEREAGEVPEYRATYYGTGEYELAKPMDMVVSNNCLYVTDAGRQDVVVFDLESGEVLSAFGQGEFQFPYGITADSDGNIYVADTDLDKISIYSPEGTYIEDFTPVDSANAIESPSAIRIYDDKLYVPEINTGVVKVFDLEGNLLLEIAEPADSEYALDSPNGVAVDTEGNIYISDTMNARVLVYDKDGNFVKELGGRTAESSTSELANPRGIAVDENGYVYVVDLLAGNIAMYTPEGDLQTVIGDGVGSEDNQFYQPSGLYIDENGTLYITDRMNQRIQVYS